MKDRYSTEKDGRPARLDSFETSGRFPLSIDRMIPIALIIITAASIYTFSSTRNLTERVKLIEADLTTSREQIKKASERIARLELDSQDPTMTEKPGSLEEVKDVQYMLMALGYDPESGAGLKAAIQRFQNAHELVPSGDIADSRFRKALREELGKYLAKVSQGRPANSR